MTGWGAARFLGKLLAGLALAVWADHLWRRVGDLETELVSARAEVHAAQVQLEQARVSARALSDHYARAAEAARTAAETRQKLATQEGRDAPAPDLLLRTVDCLRAQHGGDPGGCP